MQRESGNTVGACWQRNKPRAPRSTRSTRGLMTGGSLVFFLALTEVAVTFQRTLNAEGPDTVCTRWKSAGFSPEARAATATTAATRSHIGFMFFTRVGPPTPRVVVHTQFCVSIVRVWANSGSVLCQHTHCLRFTARRNYLSHFDCGRS